MDSPELSFEEKFPHLRDFSTYLDVLKAESDRGMVMISVSALDEILRKTIAAFLLDHKDAAQLLEGFNAPLGTFSSRTLAAFAMGLISEQEYRDLGSLRKIRNRFAHDVAVTFQNQQITALCQNLTIAVKTASLPRKRVRNAATALILRLTNRPHFVGKLCLQYGNWKYG